MTGKYLKPDDAWTEKLSVARSLAIMHWPFLAAVLVRLAPRWVPPDAGLTTMAVDAAWRLYINPAWFMTQTNVTLALILTGHEMQHCLGDHSERLTEYNDDYLVDDKGVRSPFANIAHDLAINSNLQTFVDAGKAYREQTAPGQPTVKIECPKEACYPQNFKDDKGNPFPVGLISEGYAALLSKLPKAPSGGGGGGAGASARGHNAKQCGKPCPGSGQCGSGGGQGKQPWEEDTEPNPDDATTGTSRAEREVLRNQTARDALAQQERHRGTVPAGLERWAEVLLAPAKVPWQQVLKAETKAALNWALGRTDYSYKRPNRRNAGRDVILPGMFRPVPGIAVALDTSGSMGAKDFEHAFNEMREVFRQSGMPAVPVFSCDTEVSDVQWVTRIDQVKMKGGGGTDMGTAIARAAQIKGTRLIIVMTDGVTPWGEPPGRGIRVVACLTQAECGSYPIPDWIRPVRAYDV